MHGVGFFHHFSDFRLDIVGIVAILGEGSTSRNAQASALSWHHVLPRIYPAPQALLKHHQQKNLPTEPGVVIGALSGRIRNELNFFTQLLHEDNLPKYGVQLLEIHKKKPDGASGKDAEAQTPVENTEPAFEVKKNGHLVYLSILGCCMSVSLLGLSIWQNDGPALLATCCLSATSSLVGLASWCTFDKTEETPDKARKGTTPLGDVVIYYPQQAAFRVVRCTDVDSRLYFRYETCEHYYSDNAYRTVALFSTVLLMCGLIMLGNSGPNMQAAFAASYILLNALYWASSAWNPREHVWEHNFEITHLGFTQRMITVSGTTIEPERSELYPALEDDEELRKAIIDRRSSQYYATGAWRERKVKRVHTIDSLIPHGHHAHPATAKSRPALLKIPSIKYGSWWKSTSVVEIQDKELFPLENRGRKRSLTSALWTVIALTGTSMWARTSQIAPDNEVWDMWLDEAEVAATGRWSKTGQEFVPACKLWKDLDGKSWIQLPKWPYQERLSELFEANSKAERQRWESPIIIKEYQKKLAAIQSNLLIIYLIHRTMNRWVKKKKREQASGGKQSLRTPETKTTRFGAGESTIRFRRGSMWSRRASVQIE